jgi:integrase
MLAQNVRKDHVQKLYAYLMDEVSPHRARHTIKFLKRVWNVCEANDKLRGNPFKIIQLDTDPICDVVWTERQVTRFVEASDELGYWSIGTLALLCYDLCQRPGDMRQLRWDNFDGETFTFIQEKTKASIIVDASPRIISRIVPRHNQAGSNETIVNYEKTGKPYDRWKYNEIAQKIRKHCMLPDKLKIKFLRHSGATVLGESGATEDEISAVTGHKSRQMLNIYVKKTKKMASSAQNKRFSHEHRRI